MGKICCKDKSLRGESIEDYLIVFREEEERLKKQIKLDGNLIRAGYSNIYSGLKTSEDRDSRAVQVNYIKIKISENLDSLNDHVNEKFLHLEGPLRVKEEKVYMTKLEKIWASLESVKYSNFKEEVKKFNF
jgi:hypothetical protein